MRLLAKAPACRFAFLALLSLVCGQVFRGQLLFTSGTDTNQALFERINGQSVQINTGLSTHNLPGLSRTGQFVSFGTPDIPQGNGINPSADLYVYDRASAQTRRIVDHTSAFDGANQTWIDVLSSEVSPNGLIVAYGISIYRGLGGTAGASTNELNIVDMGTGLLISNPTIARGPTSDAFAAEFRGISFTPDGNSFVTPLYRYIGVNDPNPIELPTIVRFDRNPVTGDWILAANLSLPQWARNPQTFIGSAIIHTYPALSPSGRGLAYFSVLVPDASTGTQPWVSRLVVANSDGSGARILAEFTAGDVPTGLTWTTDGTRLVASLCQQTFTGTGFIPATRRSESAVYSVLTATAEAAQITELGKSNAPLLPLNIPQPFSLANVPINITPTDSGSMVIQATGIPNDRVLTLLRSTDNLGSFTFLQEVSGAQLSQGIVLPSSDEPVFYRLAQ